MELPHYFFPINPLNAELNPICHLLALLGAHHIFHVSGLRVNLKIAMPSLANFPLPFPTSVSNYSQFFLLAHSFRITNVTVDKVTVALLISFTLLCGKKNMFFFFF